MSVLQTWPPAGLQLEAVRGTDHLGGCAWGGAQGLRAGGCAWGGAQGLRAGGCAWGGRAARGRMPVGGARAAHAELRTLRPPPGFAVALTTGGPATAAGMSR